MFIFLLVLTDEQRGIVEQIFRDHNEKFKRISFKIVGSEESAADAVSAAYIKIMDHIEKISSLPCPQMVPFCVTIVKNTSLDLLRQSKKTASIEWIEEVEDEGGSHLEEEYVKSVDIQLLASMIGKLPPADRHFVQMRFALEMSYGEIARFLGISEEAAKKRGQRILQKLKRFYMEEGEL